MSKADLKEPVRGKESHEMWARRINAALRWRRNLWNADKRWEQSRRLLRFQHWKGSVSAGSVFDDTPTSDTNADRVTVNVTLSTVRDFAAFLIGQAPKFIGKPRRPDGGQRARLKGEMLNYVWREFRMQRHMKRAVFDGVAFGVGIIKTGFVTPTDIKESNRPDKDGRIEYDSFRRAGRPFIKRVSPDNFLIDPQARDRDIDTARWVAEFFFVPKRDLVVDGRYAQAVRDKIAAGTVEPETRRVFIEEANKATADDAIFDETDEVDTSDLVVCYELWDKKYNSYRVYAKGAEAAGPLVDEPWPYDYLDGFPYEVYSFMKLPDEMYGVSLPHIMEDQQLELNRIRSAQFRHRRNFGNRKYQALENGIDDIELTKLLRGPDGTIVRVKIPNAVSAIENPPLPQDSERVESAIKEDLRVLTGQDKLMEGSALPSRTSASEIRARMGVMNMKVEDSVAEVDEFVTRVANQVLQHMVSNLDRELVIRLEGSDGEAWDVLDPESVRDEIDLELVSTVAEREDPQMKRQQSLALFQNILQTLPMLAQFGVKINVQEMFVWVMSQFEDKELMRFISAEPLPMPMGPMQSGGPDAAQGAMPPDPQSAAVSAASAGPESAAMGGMLGALTGGGPG